MKPHIKLLYGEWTVPLRGESGYGNDPSPPFDIWWQALCWCRRNSPRWSSCLRYMND